MNPNQIDEFEDEKQKLEKQRREDQMLLMEDRPEPRPAETTKERMDEKAISQQHPAPLGPGRPQPPSTKSEQGSVIVAKHLAPQLGTDPEYLGQGRWDERKVAVLNDLTVSALSHFSFRNVYDGVRYWGHICEWELTGSQGIGGLGRRHMLQAIAASSGVQSIEKAEKPNAIARNLWARGWKDKAEKEGKMVEE